MSDCVRLRSKTTSICAGSLNKAVSLKVRSITPAPGGSVDYTETMVTLADTYAMIETPNAHKIFDGVSPVGSPISHVFYIRYRSDVTNETFILFDSVYYDILQITNLNAENRYLKLDTTRSGPSSSNASVVSAIS